MNTNRLIADSRERPVETEPTNGYRFAAVLLDADHPSYQVTECPHLHRTREAAERCAETWLRRAIA